MVVEIVADLADHCIGLLILFCAFQRSLRAGKLIAQESGAEGFAVYGNVTVEDSVKDMVAAIVGKYGRIDLLVNNCGMALESRLGLRICDTDVELWDKSINLNLKSVFLCCKHVILVMIENGGGAICNVSSLAGYFPAFGASYIVFGFCGFFNAVASIFV